jgi:hypothetical protein
MNRLLLRVLIKLLSILRILRFIKLSISGGIIANLLSEMSNTYNEIASILLYLDKSVNFLNLKLSANDISYKCLLVDLGLINFF